MGEFNPTRGSTRCDEDLLYFAVYLGETATQFTEPLSAAHIFRKHPLHGVLYQNWTCNMLTDGDVLVVRHHSRFFAAANVGANTFFQHVTDSVVAAPQLPISHTEESAPRWRSQVWIFFSDSSSSRYVIPTLVCHTLICW